MLSYSTMEATRKITALIRNRDLKIFITTKVRENRGISFRFPIAQFIP